MVTGLPAAGKAFGARLVFYPLMMLLPVAVWLAASRARGSDRTPLLCLGIGLLVERGGVRPRWALTALITGVGALLAILWELGAALLLLWWRRGDAGLVR